MKALGSILVLGIIAVMLGAATNTVLLMQATTAAIELLRPEPVEEETEELEVPGFWSFRTREIDNLVASLESRKVRLDEREKRIRQMEDYLASEKKEMDEGRANIEELKTDFDKKVRDLELAEEENMKELAVMYTNLPAETSVEVFKEMEDGFVLRILTQMDAEVVSGIFQAMADQGDDPEFGVKRVVRLTEMLRLVQKQ